jgi:Uma2 family endonuclease
MASPSGVHQELIGLLHLIFAGYVRSRKGTCKVFLSPFDVQLDCDNRTMVEPDLLVICSREKIRMRCLYGAPDLAVEIVSPSSRRKDMILKTHKYEHAGVREYWIIDPGKRQVIVYDFANESYPMIYGFEDRIPVGIWEGDLTVDFAQISEEIAYLYEEGMESE